MQRAALVAWQPAGLELGHEYQEWMEAGKVRLNLLNNFQLLNRQKIRYFEQARKNEILRGMQMFFIQNKNLDSY